MATKLFVHSLHLNIFEELEMSKTMASRNLRVFRIKCHEMGEIKVTFRNKKNNSELSSFEGNSQKMFGQHYSFNCNVVS